MTDLFKLCKISCTTLPSALDTAQNERLDEDFLHVYDLFIFFDSKDQKSYLVSSCTLGPLPNQAETKNIFISKIWCAQKEHRTNTNSKNFQLKQWLGLKYVRSLLHQRERFRHYSGEKYHRRLHELLSEKRDERCCHASILPSNRTYEVGKVNTKSHVWRM